MAYNFVRASSMRMRDATWSDTLFSPPNPSTYCMTARPTLAATRMCAISHGTDANTANMLDNGEIDDTLVGRKIFYWNSTVSGVGYSTFSSAAHSWTLNTWAISSVITPLSGSNMSMYLDDTKTTGASSSGGAVTQGTMIFGAQLGNGPSYSGYYDGDLARVGAHNVVLTDREQLSFNAGFSPRRIRPQSLKAYYPLVRELIDVCRRASMTPTNSPTQARHPRTYGM